MVEIFAVIRRYRLAATRYELQRAGVAGYSFFSAFGRGRQRGLKSTNGMDGGHGFLPRMIFYLVTEADRASVAVEAIIRANQTGEFGDGRIFVTRLESAMRITEKVSAATVHEASCAGVC